MGRSRLAITKKLHTCAKEDSCKGIHVHCRSSPDYNYAQIHVVDMYVTCGRAFFVVQRSMG